MTIEFRGIILTGKGSSKASMMSTEERSTFPPSPGDKAREADSVEIANAVESDLTETLLIYNHVLLNSTAIYSETPATEAEHRQWWTSRTGKGFPVVVARRNQRIVGFASFGEFRAWPCYADTIEHSVHVDAAHRGVGVGRLLVIHLLERARLLGKHMMIGGIDSDNAASLHMHRKLGFIDAGYFREVGRKFGRRLDLVFLQKRLTQEPSQHNQTGRDSADRNT